MPRTWVYLRLRLRLRLSLRLKLRLGVCILTTAHSYVCSNGFLSTLRVLRLHVKLWHCLCHLRALLLLDWAETALLTYLDELSLRSLLGLLPLLDNQSCKLDSALAKLALTNAAA